MADQLNVLFTPNRLSNRLDEFVTRYQPEMAEHQCKWFECYNGWDKNVNKVRHFISGRTGVVRQHFVQQYAEITDTTLVSLTANPIQGGKIEFSTLTLKSEHFPWQGIYFSGVDIPIKAIPAPGYEFVSWSDSSLGINPETTVNLSTHQYNLTANFQLIVDNHELAQKDLISIFPNPTSENIYVNTKALAGNSGILKIVDLSGRIVYYQDVAHFPQGNYPIQVKHFPQGSYNLEIRTTDGSVITKQFVKTLR